MDTPPPWAEPETEPLSASKRLESVDALRGVAALAVVVSHIPHFILMPGHWNGLLFLPAHYGIKGVVLFLVISGFCIHLGTARRAARSGCFSCNWTAFWRRRFVRLYPPYLAAIVFSLVVLVCCERHGSTFRAYADGNVSFAADLLTHLLMIHNLFLDYFLGLGNGAFWTLGLEEQLYALYAVYLLLRSRLAAGRTWLVVAALTCAWYLGTGVLPGLGGTPIVHGWFNWPFGYWAIWVLGALAAEAAVGAIRLPQWCYSRTGMLASGALGAFCYTPLLAFFQVPQYVSAWWGANSPLLNVMTNFWSVNRLGDFAFAVAFFVLINRWIATESRGAAAGTIERWLARVGVMSYSLYLVHLPVLVMAEKLFNACSIGHSLVGIPLRYIVQMPLCLAAAAVFFKVVESRFLNTPPAQPAVTVTPRRQAA